MLNRKTKKGEAKMNKQELEKRIDNLESSLFILAMKDTWTSNDFETRREWTAELFKLREQLKEIEQ